MRLFWRLCRISFWIVLAVVALGVFESYYLDEDRAAFIGCRWGDLGLSCADGPLKVVKEILLNLPVLFVLAVLMALEGPAWVVLKLLIGLIVVLALVHVGRIIVRGATTSRRSDDARQA
jgi:hypothetical protein